MTGQLVVFEGPDGTGKSSIVTRLFSTLKDQGENVQQDWFPGRRPNTLGNLIYKLHHHKQQFGIESYTQTSLQALHIAAHLDLIETHILPFLETGGILLLDRYWWSTWVYGTTFGVSSEVLKHLIEAEKALWGSAKPSALFLIERKSSLKNENLQFWQNLSKRYSVLHNAEVDPIGWTAQQRV